MNATSSSLGSSERPLVVRCLGLFDDDDSIDWSARFPRRSLTVNGVRFLFGGRGHQDVLAVLDDLRYDYRATVREGGVWVWHTEATMPKPYDDSFDLVFTHVDRTNDTRFQKAPPVLDWWVKKSLDELVAMDPPEKTLTMSAIASTRAHIAGHHIRNAFITRIEQELPEIALYGRGRQNTLDDKWDGLAPYRYTIAIENSSTPDYWTEKITDAFMAFTVPLYFGAPNITDYFPPGSVIWLPIDDPDRAIDVIRQTLEDDDWDRRLPAIQEARKRIFDRWCLAQQLARAVQDREVELRTAPFNTVRVRGRRIWKGGWIRGAGIGGNGRVHGRALYRGIAAAIRKTGSFFTQP